MEESKKRSRRYRLNMLSWLGVPLIVVWICTNYLIGLSRVPAWQKETKRDQTTAAEVKAQTAITPQLQAQDAKVEKEGMVTLWFDDGWSSQYTEAFPVLKEANFKGALAVPTKLIGYDSYMSWAQVKQLYKSGWEITSHTRNHSCVASQLTADYVESELAGSLADLNSYGLSAEQFVTPCGIDSKVIKTIAKKYYLSLRTSEPGLNELPVLDPYKLVVETVGRGTSLNFVNSWLNEAKNNKRWLILMFHQIDNSNQEYSVTEEMFQKIIEAVDQSNLPVVLPRQALQVVSTK